MILELELTLYKRLSLNNIRYFKMTMKEIAQIILGTNGSGKSAILQEMSPLPANKANYFKGGKKRILLTHNGKVYELISDFTDGQDHYFWCEGENLNIGRTVTVQRELVKEHFNLTSEGHELMLGEELFTKMSPGRRKELFMQLCTVDYTFAVKLYKKIQERWGQVKGALKLAKERLGKEMIQLFNEEELESMRSRVAVLSNESRSLYLARNVNALPLHASQNNLVAAVSAIHDLKTRFSNTRQQLGIAAYISPSEFQDDINDIKNDLAGVGSIYKRLTDEFLELSVELSNSEELEGEDAAALKDLVIANNDKIRTLLERRKQPLEGLRAIDASNSMQLVYEPLVSVLTQLPPDPEGKYTSQALTEVTEQIKLLSMSLSVNKEKLAGVVHREKHLADLANSTTVACPECTHEWKVGYDKSTHEAVKQRIAQGREAVAKLEKDLAAATTQQEELASYAELYKEYVMMTRNAPALLPLWTLIASENSIKTSPSHALTLVELVRADIFVELQVEAIRDKVKSDLQRLKLVEAAQSSNVKEKKKKQETLEVEIGNLSRRESLLQKRLRDVSTKQRQATLLWEIADKVREAQKALEQNSFAVIDSIKNEVIDKALVENHTEFSALSTRINSIDQQASVIANIKKMIEDYEEEEKAFKALSDTLSPTEGLIAEGMLGFIRNYVARMNALIAKIWTYPMIVHDCSTEQDSAELNYKFPLTTPNLPEPVPDVANGSAGQREMLDLSWRVIAAQCMQLDYGPLFLDEFGKTFDEAHREAAVQVITQLMDQLNFSQLFMISHYESCYGAFYNAQLTVIDKRNITVPANRKINEYTEITT